MQRETSEHPLTTAEIAATEQQPIERRTEDRSSQRTPLFAEQEGSEFRARWSDVQASFVDEPRQAVEQADTLVAEVMQRLAQVFADERQRLEQQWDRGGETNTEELRLALQRYRSFFDRLLAM
jgi:hypothetical protein